MKNKFRDAFSGLNYLLKDKSVLLQCFIAIIAIIVSILLGFTLYEVIIVLILCALVISLEALNSALEDYMDIKNSAYDPKIGRIKDMMAGSVLIASIFSLIVGLLIVIKHIF